MGEILVRNLEDEVIERLRTRAVAEKVSVEELARRALREAAKPAQDEVWAEVDRIRALSTPRPDFDSTQVIREWRDRGWHGD